MRAVALGLLLLLFSPAAARGEVGRSLPPGFPLIRDESLGVPVIGFGAAGPLERTPVLFLHGNNDTPFPTECNRTWGHTHDLAEAMRRRGYALSELWGLGYQGAQCDLQTRPTNRSSPAHSTVANVPDLRRFVQALLTYTGARRLDIVGHSLGGTLAREWMRQDGAHGLVRSLVTIDSPHHGIINCSPGPRNYYALDANGGFTPDSAICSEYGSDRTPLLSALNAVDETPGPTRYVSIYNADTSFVYFDKQDGAFPPVPAEDREGQPHDFSQSPRLAGAVEVPLTGTGRYDTELQTAHLGILQAPATARATYRALAPQDPSPPSAPPPPARQPAKLSLAVRPVRVARPPYIVLAGGRLRPSDGAPCTGTVGIRVRSAGRTVSARLAGVRADCRFRARLRFAQPQRLRSRRLLFVARYFGSDALLPARGPRRALSLRGQTPQCQRSSTACS